MTAALRDAAGLGTSRDLAFHRPVDVEYTALATLAAAGQCAAYLLRAVGAMKRRESWAPGGRRALAVTGPSRIIPPPAPGAASYATQSSPTATATSKRSRRC